MNILKHTKVRLFGFYNFTAANLNNWRAAQAAVVAGTRNAALLCMGDSTTAGQGSTNNGISSNARSNSYPIKLAALIPNGLDSSFFGNNNVGAGGGSLAGFDSRITQTGAWTSSNATLGGLFVQSPASASSLNFALPNSIDTIIVDYAIAPGNGTFTVAVDGGAALATQATAGANAQGTVTVNPTAGVHTINLAWSSGGACFFNGVRAFRSTTKVMQVWNSGSCTSLIAGIGSTTAPWGSALRAGALAPDLTIICLGINDWDSTTAIDVFIAGINTLVNKVRPTGDVILMSGIPTAIGGGAPIVKQAAFAGRMLQFAREINIPFIDVFNLMYGSHTIANSLGWKFDTYHCNNSGYTKIAGWVNQALAGGFVSN